MIRKHQGQNPKRPDEIKTRRFQVQKIKIARTVDNKTSRPLDFKIQGQKTSHLKTTRSKYNMPRKQQG